MLLDYLNSRCATLSITLVGCKPILFTPPVPPPLLNWTPQLRRPHQRLAQPRSQRPSKICIRRQTTLLQAADIAEDVWRRCTSRPCRDSGTRADTRASARDCCRCRLRGWTRRLRDPGSRRCGRRAGCRRCGWRLGGCRLAKV